MLKKLYKYDFRASVGSVLPLSLATIPLCVIAALCIFMISRLEGVILAFPITLLIITCIAIYVCPIAAIISLFVRFHRSFFSDEGYLTMSLPVTSKTLMLSKLIYTAVYQVIILLSLLVGLALCFGILDLTLKTGIYSNLIYMYKYIMASIYGSYASTFQLVLLFTEVLLTLFVSAFSSVMIVFCSITLGSMVMKRHHFWGTVLFYIIISNVLSFVSTIPLFVTGMTSVVNISLSVHMTLIISFILNLLMGAGLFFFVSWIIEKKLNLN